jgi:hypothetical protein
MGEILGSLVSRDFEEFWVCLRSMIWCERD